MATEKSLSRLKGAITTGGEMGYNTAARRYVIKGLPDLMKAQGIPVNPINKQKFINKMVPIISNQMKTERTRTYSRAKGITAREEKAAAKAKAKKEAKVTKKLG